MRSRGLPFCDTKASFPETPFLLTRLSEPGIKDVALAQFDEAPIARHHRVSIHTAGGGPMWKLSRLTGRASALDSNRRRCRGRPPRESRPNFTMRDSRWVALGLIHYTACGQSGRCPRGAHGSFSIVGRVVGYTSVVHIDKTDGECIATTEVEAGSVPEICLRDGVPQRANATGAARSR